MMSNYAGLEPFDKACRWDKSKKEYTDVDRPFIVKEYNTYIGGVDMILAGANSLLEHGDGTWSCSGTSSVLVL
jgi:hypothetical protein